MFKQLQTEADIVIGLNITFIGQCIDKQSVFFKSDHQSQLMKFTLPFVPTEKSFLQIYYFKLNNYFFNTTAISFNISEVFCQKGNM